jgi:DNA-binding LacI/PurR family transcriptional regulator
VNDPLTVVVFSPMAGGFYYGGVLAGITREVAAAGGHVVLVQTKEADLSNDQSPDIPAFDAETTWDHASGFISLAASAPISYHARLAATGKPLVIAGTLMEGVDVASVMADNAGGVRAAIEHLIEHGHSRIGFLGNLEQYDMQERHAAYIETLAANGLGRLPEFEFVAVDNTDLGGRRAAPAVAAAVGRMSALICATDRNALGLMRTLPQFGVQPGRDLAIVGFDDIQRARRSKPSLSTVSQQFSKAGELTGRLLVAQLRGEAVAKGRHVTSSAFIARESCGCEPSVRSSANAPAGDETDCARAALLARVAAVVAAGHEVDSNSDAAIMSVVHDAIRLLDAVGRGSRMPDKKTLEASAARMFAGKRDSDSAASVVALLVDYGQDFLGALSLDHEARAGVQQAIIAMAHAYLVVQADHHTRRSAVTETTMREQYDIDVRLLRRDTGDPRSLAWFASSSVSAGCLALWDDAAGSGDLRISACTTPLVGSRRWWANAPRRGPFHHRNCCRSWTPRKATWSSWSR